MVKTLVSDLLSIGASGTKVYQKALATVSTNIGNAENPNFVRRDLRLGELSITGAIDPYHNAQIRFGGVDISGVSRSYDPFLEANARFTGSALYEAETRSSWMSSIESALGDGEHGVGSHLTSVFTSAERLSAAPFDTVLRNEFIANIDASVTAINRTAASLTQTAGQIFQSTEHEIADLNDALESLASTNIKLRGSTDGSTGQASLLDQRDTALAVITERLDVTLDFSDKGMVNLEYDGKSLVQIGNANLVEATAQPVGAVALSINGANVAPPRLGSLAALISSANTNGQRQIELDQLADQFGTQINNWQSNGVTNLGSAGAALIDVSGGATGLTLLSRNPLDLAIATPGGASNGNILSFSALRGPSGVEHNWTNIVGVQATLTSAARGEVSASETQHRAAREARDSLASVDLDREAADLIRFQQAYDASARVIQVARETMQSIFAIF